MKLLQAKGICKRFYSTCALSNVDFDLEEGEVLALAGENGAGKSTMMNVLLGIHHPDEGTMTLAGEPYNPKGPHDALEKGISMIHQELRLVPSMTVADNVWIGRVKRFSSGGIYFPERCVEATKKLFEEYGIEVNPKEKVANLSVAQMQMVEIARAISYDSKIVIMDEPTSALSDKEVEVLYKIIRQLSSRGKSIIFISHKLEEVFEIADRVTIFRDGHMISTQKVSDITMNDLINGIAGREVKDLYPKEDVPRGEKVLEVRGLRKAGQYQDISFEVHAGEVLGLCGLVGAGRTEIMNGIYGIDPIDGGEILLDGKKIVNRTPRQALNNGIAMVTEDRLRRGVVLKMNVRMNMTLAYFYKICKASFINMRREEKDTAEMIKTLHVKTAGPEMPIWSLSGGNQQKVMVGRALLTKPKVLILDEPTRGVDVGAKSEIYEYCNQLAKEGIAIILISSDLPEVMGMSDRLLVIREGKIIGRHDRGEATAEELMAEMFGLSSTTQKREDLSK
ncbi:MAG TPA: sugar ABC transporter ATP-binding protein [Candidatus Pygmaiobacter gallistercoris]|nr:sugar ABC transporter ATP-binding protein [Candidatus Pygmaiobacter gallistercoris]